MAKDKTWVGGCHAFELKIAQLRALEDKCDCGPEWLVRRIGSEQWKADDILYVIRFGLEGAGMPSDDARKLVRDHLEEKTWNLKPTAAVAAEILIDALFIGDDDEGEA